MESHATMNKHNGRALRSFRRLTILGVVSLVLAACSATGSTLPVVESTTPQPDGVTQTSEAGEVTVTATWLAERRAPVFSVVLNTHSVDLDAIDLIALATLKVDDNEVRPIAWNAAAGGHHREGELTFPTTTADGSAVIGPETQAIELVIRDVAGVPERTFRWIVTS